MVIHLSVGDILSTFAVHFERLDHWEGVAEWTVLLSRHCQHSVVGLRWIVVTSLFPNCPPFEAGGRVRDRKKSPVRALRSRLVGHSHHRVSGIPEEKTATVGLSNSFRDHFPRIRWQCLCSMSLTPRSLRPTLSLRLWRQHLVRE